MIFPALSQTNEKQFTISSVHFRELTSAAQDRVNIALQGIDPDHDEVIAKPHGVGYRIKRVKIGDELHHHLLDDWSVVTFDNY
jgi:hypothetical protein